MHIGEDDDFEQEEEEEEEEEGGADDDDFDEQEAADFLRAAEEGNLDGVQIVRTKPELLEVQDEVGLFCPRSSVLPQRIHVCLHVFSILCLCGNRCVLCGSSAIRRCTWQRSAHTSRSCSSCSTTTPT